MLFICVVCMYAGVKHEINKWSSVYVFKGILHINICGFLHLMLAITKTLLFRYLATSHIWPNPFRTVESITVRYVGVMITP